MSSVGIVIGWNENLHTLGPPWRRTGHHWADELPFVDEVARDSGLDL